MAVRDGAGGFVLSGDEERVVRCLLDTFVPPLSEGEAVDIAWKAGVELEGRQLGGMVCGGSSEASVASFERSVNRLVASERSEVRLLLGLLGSAGGTAFLTGSLFSWAPFPRRSRAAREANLLAMAASSVPLRRKAFNALKRLCCGVAALALDGATKGCFNCTST